jgi:hypothetical protein
MKAEFADVRSDMTNMRSDMADMRSELRRHSEVLFESLGDHIRILDEGLRRCRRGWSSGESEMGRRGSVTKCDGALQYPY